MLTSLIIAAQIAAASASPGSSDGRMIWNDLHADMTKAEVKSLYPKNSTELGEGCYADINPRYNKGKLDQVNLEWSTKDDNQRCADVVYATLSAKYGQPALNETQIKANDCGNGNAGGIAGAMAGICEAMGGGEPDHYTFHRWFHDEIEITLKRDSENDYQWWLVYRPQVMPSKAAAAKL